MTLEQYLKENYKEEPVLSYEQWLIKQVDFNGNGKVDSGKNYVIRNGKQKWDGTYSKEDNAYRKLQKDPGTYGRWEAYVQTITQMNAERRRAVEASWETSQAFEKGLATEQDRFHTDNGITTIAQQEQAINAENQKLGFVKYAIVGVVGIVIVLLITRKRR